MIQQHRIIFPKRQVWHPGLLASPMPTIGGIVSAGGGGGGGGGVSVPTPDILYLPNTVAGDGVDAEPYPNSAGGSPNPDGAFTGTSWAQVGSPTDSIDFSGGAVNTNYICAPVATTSIGRFYFDSVATRQRFISDVASSGSSVTPRHALGLWETNAWLLEYGNDSVGYYSFGDYAASLSASTWYTIGYTVDSTYLNVYVDGSLDRQVAHGQTVSAPSSNDLYIGKGGVSGYNPMNGQVGEYRYWQQELSAAQHAEVHSQMSGT